MAQGITQTISVEAVSGQKAFKAKLDVSETYNEETNESSLSFGNFQVSVPGVENGVIYIYGTVQLIKDNNIISTLFNVSRGSGSVYAYREGSNWATLSWSQSVDNIEHNSDGTLTVAIRFTGFHAYMQGGQYIPGPINEDVDIVLTQISRGIVYIDDGSNNKYKVYIDDGSWHEYIPMIDTGTWERY